MTPTHIRHFRVNRANDGDRRWMLGTLQRLTGPFGCDVDVQNDGTFALHWAS